jgi:hypothetical protein
MMTATPLFELGATKGTIGAVTAMKTLGIDPSDLLSRHVTGDWGDLSTHDRIMNEEAVRDGLRIMSVYPFPNGVRLYIITEADRSMTTVLLPSEY